LTRALNEVVVVDAVRTAFGRAGEKGLFWKTRAEDLWVPLLKALIERNPAVKPEMIEDSIWGVTNLFKENPAARYGLTTMCVGRGQGYSIIWEKAV
jgi:acetyl-CoA acyltransferase